MVLVDGDIVVFRCGFAAERTHWHLIIEQHDVNETFEYKKEAMKKLDEVLPGVQSRVPGEDFTLTPFVDLEPLSHALQNVKTFFNDLALHLKTTDWDFKVFLSSGRNYRHEIAKTRPYKGNRKVEHRPTYEQEIRDYIMENYDTYVAVDEEADDLLGIWATKYPKAIIATLDKDLDQVPGWKYNWKNDDLYEITEEQGIYNFHIQLLMGDATDNIPGLPKIGAGKAAKALHGLETAASQLEEVERMYQVHSGKEDWLEYMREQGQLLWIRREPGQMWEPPQLDYDTEWDVGELSLEVE